LPQWLGVIVEGLSPLRPLKVRALDELALIALIRSEMNAFLPEDLTSSLYSFGRCRRH